MLNPYGGGGKTQQHLFGTETGKVLSRVQGTIVSSGSWLQEIIREECDGRRDVEFQAKLKDPSNERTRTADVYIKDATPEVFELKMGFEFDTKKARQELEDLEETARLMSVREWERVRSGMALFNADDEEDIAKFKAENAVTMYTGREFCDRLGISYHSVRERLREGRKDARHELLRELEEAVHLDDKR